MPASRLPVSHALRRSIYREGLMAAQPRAATASLEGGDDGLWPSTRRAALLLALRACVTAGVLALRRSHVRLAGDAWCCAPNRAVRFITVPPPLIFLILHVQLSQIPRAVRLAPRCGSSRCRWCHDYEQMAAGVAHCNMAFPPWCPSSSYPSSFLCVVYCRPVAGWCCSLGPFIVVHWKKILL